MTKKRKPQPPQANRPESTDLAGAGSAERQVYVRGRKGPGKGYRLTQAGLALVERLAAEGTELQLIAKALGMSPHAFLQLRQRQPEAEDAIGLGKARMAEELHNILMTQAREGNTVAAIYLSKARLGWTDQPQPTQQPVNVQIVQLPAPMSEDAYRLTLDAAMEHNMNMVSAPGEPVEVQDGHPATTLPADPRKSTP
jgi:hypothetical protein